LGPCGQFTATAIQESTKVAGYTTTTNIAVVADQTSELKYLLDHLPCRHFTYLLGHSFGGILVYEYLKLVYEDELELAEVAQEEALPALVDKSFG
jgi:homoserine acetyltransferase